MRRHHWWCTRNEVTRIPRRRSLSYKKEKKTPINLYGKFIVAGILSCVFWWQVQEEVEIEILVSIKISFFFYDFYTELWHFYFKRFIYISSSQFTFLKYIISDLYWENLICFLKIFEINFLTILMLTTPLKVLQSTSQVRPHSGKDINISDRCISNIFSNYLKIYQLLLNNFCNVIPESSIFNWIYKSII